MQKIGHFIYLLLISGVIIACTYPNNETTTGSKNTNEESVSSDTKTGSSIINPNNFDVALLSDLLLAELNKLRTGKKLAPLGSDNTLTKAAQDQNNYITGIGKLSHNQPTPKKETVGKRVDFYGGDFDMVGENVQLWGFMVVTSGKKTDIEYTTYAEAAKGLLDNWVSSKSHYENLVRKEFRLVGTAIQFNKNKTGLYATQVYASDGR